MSVLLERPDVDINSRDFMGETPLHHATRFGYEAVCPATFAETRYQTGHN